MIIQLKPTMDVTSLAFDIICIENQALFILLRHINKLIVAFISSSKEKTRKSVFSVL